MKFVVTQVLQALQHTVAIGACSPYFPATWAARPVQICFTHAVYWAAQRRQVRPFYLGQIGGGW